MRPLAIVAAVVALSACSSAAPVSTVCTPGESRACTCSSGAAGAQVCEDDGARLSACVCDPLDGGELDVDAAADVGSADAGIDAGVRDAGGDAATVIVLDSGSRDAGPPDGGAVCSLVEQTGCRVGEACRRTGLAVPRSGPPACEPAGSMYEWGWPDPSVRCFDGEGHDLCRAGLFCQSFGQCVQFCDPAGDPCPATVWGAAQRCRTDGIGIDPYCQPE